MNGPMNSPIRNTPPSVDIARARSRYGHHLGDVGLPGQQPDRGAGAGDEDAQREDGEVRREDAAEQGQHRQPGRADHRRAFAVAVHDGAGRDVGHDLAEPGGRDHQRRHRRRGAEVGRGDHHDRCDRALTDGEQRRRQERRRGDVPQGQRLVGHRPSSCPVRRVQPPTADRPANLSGDRAPCRGAAPTPLAVFSCGGPTRAPRAAECAAAVPCGGPTR